MIAEVIIQSNVKNLNRIFDYKIPAEYEGKGMQLVGRGFWFRLAG